LIKRKRKRLGLVIFFSQLIYVPVRVEITKYHHSHIRSIALNFLQVPERKCVVISSREKNCIRLAAGQNVPGVIYLESTSGTIVVIPIFKTHPQRNGQKQNWGNERRQLYSRRQGGQGNNAHTDPKRKCNERS